MKYLITIEVDDLDGARDLRAIVEQTQHPLENIGSGRQLHGWIGSTKWRVYTEAMPPRDPAR